MSKNKNKYKYKYKRLLLLAMVLERCTVYKYRRNKYDTWQYAVTIPGYGHPPKMKKWVDVKIIR